MVVGKQAIEMKTKGRDVTLASENKLKIIIITLTKPLKKYRKEMASWEHLDEAGAIKTCMHHKSHIKEISPSSCCVSPFLFFICQFISSLVI